MNLFYTSLQYLSNYFLRINSWKYYCWVGAAKSRQSCPILCSPIDCSPPGSAIPGILQVRTLEWVAISFSSAWKWKVKVKSLNRVRLFATSWTVAYQALPSMGFPRQEYWSGLSLLGRRECIFFLKGFTYILPNFPPEKLYHLFKTLQIPYS